MRKSSPSPLSSQVDKHRSRAAAWIVVAVMCVVLVTPAKRAVGEGQPEFWREAESLDDEFLEEARAARDSIPAELWTTFANSGWTVHLAETVVDAAPFLRGVHPRGWPRNATWENADAVHLPQNRMVIVASHRLSSKGKRVRAHRVAGVLRHEVGHAIDVALGAHGRFSDTAGFRDCYQRDLRRIQSDDRLDYYARNGGSGPTETFAELLAVEYGGGSDAPKAAALQARFVETRRYLVGALPERN